MVQAIRYHHLKKIIKATPAIIVSEARHCWRLGICPRKTAAKAVEKID
jgi:hypothetical protein